MKKTKCGGGYIYEISKQNLERVKLVYGANGNEDIKTAYKRVTKLYGIAPDLFLNAELFDFKTRKAASDIVVDGKVHRMKEGYGFAFPNNKDVVFSYNNNVNASDYIGAYPVLVKNGVKEKSEPAGIGGVRGRTALGLSDSAFYVTIIPDKQGVSLSTLRNNLIALGVKNAINLDGGGSSQGYTPDGLIYTGRKVRGFIAIWVKESKKETIPTTTNNKANSATVAGNPTTTITASTNTNTQKNTITPKGDIRTVKVQPKKCLYIRKKPSTLSRIVGKLYAGNKVTVYKTQGNWCKISNTEDKWVCATYLKK